MKTVYEELQDIEAREGILKPEAVVRFAKNPKTALHSQFEWDDAKAGYQYRLWQARHIISVQVHVSFDNQYPVKAFVSLKSDRYGGSGYRGIVSVLSDDDMRQQLLEEAMEDVRLFRAKYSKLKELEAVFLAMDKVQIRRIRTNKPVMTLATPA